MKREKHRISVNMDKDMFEYISANANKERRSISTYICLLLEDYFKQNNIDLSEYEDK